MDNYSRLLFFAILFINSISFIVVFYDKQKSKGEGERISEKTLFTLALFFGAVGIYVGMTLFRHKTKKWYFQIGIPLLLLLNVYLLGVAFNFLNR